MATEGVVHLTAAQYRALLESKVVTITREESDLQKKVQNAAKATERRVRGEFEGRSGVDFERDPLSQVHHAERKTK